MIEVELDDDFLALCTHYECDITDVLPTNAMAVINVLDRAKYSGDSVMSMRVTIITLSMEWLAIYCSFHVASFLYYIKDVSIYTTALRNPSWHPEIPQACWAHQGTPQSSSHD